MSRAALAAANAERERLAGTYCEARAAELLAAAKVREAERAGDAGNLRGALARLKAAADQAERTLSAAHRVAQAAAVAVLQHHGVRIGEAGFAAACSSLLHDAEAPIVG